MKTYLLATSNEGKAVEIRECLSDLEIALITLTDLTHPPVQPEETGETFEENAIAKAKYYFERTGISSIADDSGIHVKALNGELGVQTRRWGAGERASDSEWIEYFLNRMKNEEEKRAEFICVLALACFDSAQHDTVVHTFEGQCHGVITDSLEAEYLPGIPISACFKPEGCDHVFSDLTMEQKNRVSHRGRAVGKLREFLLETL